MQKCWYLHHEISFPIILWSRCLKLCVHSFGIQIHMTCMLVLIKQSPKQLAPGIRGTCRQWYKFNYASYFQGWRTLRWYRCMHALTRSTHQRAVVIVIHSTTNVILSQVGLENLWVCMHTYTAKLLSLRKGHCCRYMIVTVLHSLYLLVDEFFELFIALNSFLNIII